MSKPLEFDWDGLVTNHDTASTEALNLAETPRFTCGELETPSRYKNDELIKGVPVTILKQRAGDDWLLLLEDDALMNWFAQSVGDRIKMEQGIIPDGWTEAVWCHHCGLVYLWSGCPEVVTGCPWCHIPREKRP